MRRTMLVAGFLVIVLLAVPAPAQEAPKPAPEAEAPEKPAEEAPAAEEAREIKPLTGEKVQVRLKKGDVIDGVVKGARIEVQHGAKFLPAKSKEDRGAGIRIWYVRRMNGYMFFPYNTIEKLEFKGQLTRDEGIELARQIEEEQVRSERERIRIAQELEAKRRAAREAAEKKEAGEEEAPAGEEEAGATKPAAAATSGEQPGKVTTDAERAAKIRDLLRRFPPEKWKPSRLAEIKDRQLILNIYPNDEERVFMDNYDLWLEGYEIWRKEKASARR